MAASKKPILAVLGGTGKEGKGLVWRWARAGYPVLIGSRSEEKARSAAAEVRARLGDENAPVRGLTNLQAAARGEIIILAVPYAAHRALLESIQNIVRGKLVVDITVPLNPPKVTRAHMPPAGSAAREAQEILGAETPVVDAFQNIAYTLLWEDKPIDCDVLVAGTGKKNRQKVIELVEAAGLRGLDAGPIANASVIEGLTSILIYLNKTYQTHAIGIRITGLEAPSDPHE